MAAYGPQHEDESGSVPQCPTGQACLNNTTCVPIQNGSAGNTGVPGAGNSGVPTAGNGAVIGTSNIQPDGTAIFTATALATGANTIVATYSGDSNFVTSDSAAATGRTKTARRRPAGVRRPRT